MRDRQGQRPIGSSWSAPAWPGCRPRCTWPAAAARSPSSNADQHPGGRVGRLDIAGYRLDTGPTVLTMPDIIDDAFAAVGESLADRLDLMPVDPAYRASFADGSALDVHSDADAMAAEIERFAGRARGRRLPAAAGLADPAVRGRVRRVHRRQLRLAAVAADPAAGAAGRHRRIPALGPHGARVHHRRAAAAGVHLPGALRRRPAAAGAGGLCRDRLHGHRRRASTSRAAACGRCPTRWPRPPPTPASNSVTVQRFPRWSAAARG